MKKYIYISGWSDASEHLYQEFLDTGNQKIGDKLIGSVENKRRERLSFFAELKTLPNLNTKRQL